MEAADKLQGANFDFTVFKEKRIQGGYYYGGFKNFKKHGFGYEYKCEKGSWGNESYCDYT